MRACQSYLEKRGILSATIQAQRLEFDGAPSAERIVVRLGEDIQVAGQPLSRYATELLWIPYLNSDGAVTSWIARIFPTAADPHPKFLTPKRGGGPPYITPPVWAIDDKAHVPVILTEGPIKALACLQAGQAAIGLNGVFGAGSRDASDQIILHPVLSAFSWAKRFVLLAFDADITTKFEVRRALLRTYLLLTAQQADVFIITSWNADEAKGIDDFLAQSQKPGEELDLLIKDRAPFISILERSPADLRLVEEELRAIVLPRLQRTQIVRQVAKAVGVPYKDLLESISPVAPQVGTDRELNLVDETIPWDGPVDGEELLTEIYKLIGEVIWMSDAGRMTIAFWLIASYAFKAFRKFPYLRFKSPALNCGKSTAVDFLELLVFNPVVSADITPAALYRATEQFQPTVLLDEGLDSSEQIRELTQLLNAGYDANRVAIRFNNEKGVLEKFRTYCPKVIASIQRLAETTESRCLPIDMQRVPADAEKKLVQLCDIDPARFLTIKRKILALVEEHWTKIASTRPTRPDWLKTRDWDLWQSSFVIADVISRNAPNWVKGAATGLFADRVVEQSLAIEILAHMRDASKESSLVIVAGKDGKSGPFLPSQVVVDYCNGDEEASWANWKSGDSKGLTIERLAKELRRHFKIKSDRVTYQHHKVSGYWLKPFEKLFVSFLPPDDTPPSGGSSPNKRPEDSKTPPTAEDRPDITAAADKGKNIFHDPPKNTPESCPDSASDSNVETFVDRVGEMTPVLDKVQNDNAVHTNYDTSTACESEAGSRPDFRGVPENIFLAIDVETSASLQANAKVSPDALDPHKAELWVVSVADSNGNVTIHDFRKGQLPNYLQAAIATTPLIAHGAAFDLAVLEANGYKTSRHVFCSLTASRLLTAGLRDPNDLGAVLKRHLGLEIPKELSSSDFGGLFLTDDQLEYCRNDVVHLHRLREALRAKLANPADEHGDGAEGVDLVRVGELEMALIPLMVDIRLRGIQVDRPRLEQILSTYQARKKHLAAELCSELQTPQLNLAAPDQLLCALKGVGLELSDTSKETLSGVVDPVAGHLLRYREIAGLCQTMNGWLETLDSNNRLYPPLNPLGAATGRFSCQKPNLLAVPRNSEVRGCFIPEDPEHVLIEADYANIEMRIAAWFGQEPRMLEVFRNGGDIYGETAERILRDRQARQPAKPVNFGCLYGGGAERLRITARTEFGIEFSQEQAKQYHDQFFNAYGNLRRWHEAARDSSAKLTYGASVFGRRRWADPADRPDHWDWNRFQLATNYEVQATGADALKIALRRLYSQTAGSETRILLPVHDSILVQTPQHHAQKVVKIVCETMRAAFLELLGKDFPVAVDYKISQRWGQGK